MRISDWSSDVCSSDLNWRYLPASDEILWFSERDNWGNLYLYDATSGRLKHAVTTGEGNVTEVLRVDPGTRTVWFRGVGMEDGRNPYYQHFYKVSLDGGEPMLLTPEDRSEEHTSELQSLMRTSYAVFCLKKK